MSAVFDKIVGQSNAVRYLLSAFRKGRIAQTMIFHGPPYVGKESTAVALASLMLCDSGDGCGTCRSCKQVAAYQHPDFNYFFPCPASWYKDSSAKGEAIGAWAANESRLGEPLPDPNLLISIEAVREMTRVATRSAFGGKGRVFVVRNADRMRAEAQNAFLKLLEEAPSDVYIMLHSTKPGRVLPTVRSRAQHVRFTSLRAADWIHVFQRLRDVGEPQAELLFRLSGRSLARAAVLLDDEQKEARMLALELLRKTPERKAGSWARNVLSHFGTRIEREDLDILIDFAILLARDALACQGGASRAMLVNIDLEEETRRLAHCHGSELLIRLIHELEETRHAARLNIDPRLLCFRMERLVSEPGHSWS
jgi:DNA polymerase-3 subunit delta'